MSDNRLNFNDMFKGLEKCKIAGRFVTEDEDEVDGDEASDRTSIPWIARQAKAANVINCLVYHSLLLFAKSSCDILLLGAWTFSRFRNCVLGLFLWAIQRRTKLPHTIWGWHCLGGFRQSTQGCNNNIRYARY
jgi:hypothetical protein